MRIAFFEPRLRVCGVDVGLGYALQGARARGHQADLITFTKSGKPSKSWTEGGHTAATIAQRGGRWWRQAPTRTERFKNAATVLNQYDLVVLGEPKHPHEDREARKAEALPNYIEILGATRTPWTTALWGPQYDGHRAPYAQQLFQAGNFTGVIFEFSAGSRETFPISPRAQFVPARMPYVPAVPVEAPVASKDRRVGMTGRIVPVKGQQLFLLTASRMAKDIEFELWGTGEIGLGPNPTRRLFELLTGVSEKDKQADWGDWTDQKYEGAVGLQVGDKFKADVTRAWPWVATREDGQTIAYHGGYTDGVSVAMRFGVHVNLTSASFSGGLVEYVTMEAVDAGCLCVVPKHCSGPGQGWRFAVLPTHSDNRTWSFIKKPESLPVADEIGQGIDDALSVLGTPYHDEIVEHNRRALREQNDPGLFISQLEQL